jgi:nucleotide-binding universal stress UspA family protein
MRAAADLIIRPVDAVVLTVWETVATRLALAGAFKESFEGIPKAILETADHLSARLIVCGQRGRGVLRSTLLGSVSHTLASHTRRPILIAPEHPQ